jgi:hypothetical protein
MSVCGEKADMALPVDDLRGASRAMAVLMKQLSHEAESFAMP